MIETFISKNQNFLYLYGRMARIVGWILLILGFSWLWLQTISVASRIGDWKATKIAWDNVPSGLFMFLIFGMVALGWKIVMAVILVLTTLGQVLVLIGLGMLWRRVMPVLEEARTLV